MDTNCDGTVDSNDDPFAPITSLASTALTSMPFAKQYFPDDPSHVDWVALSIYWFGNWADNLGYVSNSLMTPSTYVTDEINGKELGADPPPATLFNFYQIYSANLNKPFFVTEIGAAYYSYKLSGPSPQTPDIPANRVAITGGPTEVELKQSLWANTYCNQTFLTQTFPNLRAVSIFEWQKLEGSPIGTHRDFRVTSPSVLASFLTDFKAVAQYFSFAKPLAAPLNTSSTTSPGVGSNSGSPHADGGSSLPSLPNIGTGAGERAAPMSRALGAAALILGLVACAAL
ncbi:hypothetical protein BDK51DRAFT_47510 [Blyttiomyces helicus]|uniref:Uncharacterized protein n=1 Tax=Blyttiomyces helicus TaxID=388810 RepID=A0A4P9W524_9FUNG|nr:hypothetical protein BDK51DRAFT_47510 [Blyttiomyces helicus]|eukprot:RKO86375.1 hypothetical protein BDK51DRAFT_47510 [Blyttiomyces helicus]